MFGVLPKLHRSAASSSPVTQIAPVDLRLRLYHWITTETGRGLSVINRYMTLRPRLTQLENHKLETHHCPLLMRCPSYTQILWVVPFPAFNSVISDSHKNVLLCLKKFVIKNVVSKVLQSVFSSLSETGPPLTICTSEWLLSKSAPFQLLMGKIVFGSWKLKILLEKMKESR